MSMSPEARPRERHIILVMVGLMTTMLLASLDQTIFSTALPTIVGELDGVSHMLWITTAYILAATIMMPVYGKLGDLIGRKSLLLIAIVVLILFGRGKVAGLMGEFGKGITSFKRGLNEGKQEIENATAENARDITPEKEKV